MLFRAAVACYEIFRQCLCCLFLSILCRPVRCVSSYPPCLVLFLLLRVVSSCLLLRLIRFLLSCPSCLVFARPDRLVFLLYFCVYSSPSVTRLVRIISVCSSCFALSRGVCPFSSSAFFYFVMSVYVSSCPPCLGLSVLSCPVRLVSFHSSGLVLFWFVLSVLPCLIRLVSISYFMNPNHDIPNAQSRPTSCKTENYFLSFLQYCHAYNFLSCMTANVGR